MIMPFVPAICTQCGASLQVDSSQEAALCKFCKTPFVVETAINSYNNSYNINATNVTIIGGGISDFKIRAGVLEEYTGEATDVIIPDNVISIAAAE